MPVWGGHSLRQAQGRPCPPPLILILNLRGRQTSKAADRACPERRRTERPPKIACPPEEVETCGTQASQRRACPEPAEGTPALSSNPESPATLQQQTSSNKREDPHHHGQHHPRPENRTVVRRLNKEMLQYMHKVQSHQQHRNPTQDWQNSHRGCKFTPASLPQVCAGSKKCSCRADTPVRRGSS